MKLKWPWKKQRHVPDMVIRLDYHNYGDTGAILFHTSKGMTQEDLHFFLVAALDLVEDGQVADVYDQDTMLEYLDEIERGGDVRPQTRGSHLRLVEK